MDSILLKREIQRLAEHLDGPAEGTIAELIENIKEMWKWERTIQENHYNHLAHSLRPMLASRRAKVELWIKTWEKVMEEKSQNIEY